MDVSNPPLNVFLSRPTWLPPDCVRGHEGFLEVMSALGLTPRTVGTTDFGTRSPLDQVIAVGAHG